MAEELAQRQACERSNRLLSWGHELHVWLRNDIFRERFKKGEDFGEQLPLHPVMLAQYIDGWEKRGHLRPGDSVLELGSSFGNSAILFSLAGYNVVGTEINSATRMVAVGKLTQFASQGRLVGDVEILSTSFYPPEYLELRERGDAKAPAFEEQLRERDKERLLYYEKLGQDGRVHVRENNFLTVSPGELTPSDIESFDRIFCYPWEIQIPSMLELFAKFAHPESKLLMVSEYRPEGLEEYLQELKLVQADRYVFQKE